MEPAPEPAAAPEPAPAQEAPAPEPPPPPPSLAGSYASAEHSVALLKAGEASVVTKPTGKAKKAPKPQTGTWDEAAGTITLKGKAAPIKLDGDMLVISIDGAERKLHRQPTSFHGQGFANDNGSIQLNADGTCVHGKAGIPELCTYKLEGGVLTITYKHEPKKTLTWPVWFENGGKLLHTPTETFTSTE